MPQQDNAQPVVTDPTMVQPVATVDTTVQPVTTPVVTETPAPVASEVTNVSMPQDQTAQVAPNQ